MLPFLATRSLILLMMLASKLQAKERRKKPAGWENKNRKPKKKNRIRISQAKAKTAGNENDKKISAAMHRKTENEHNGRKSCGGGGGRI